MGADVKGQAFHSWPEVLSQLFVDSPAQLHGWLTEKPAPP